MKLNLNKLYNLNNQIKPHQIPSNNKQNNHKIISSLIKISQSVLYRHYDVIELLKNYFIIINASTIK